MAYDDWKKLDALLAVRRWNDARALALEAVSADPRDGRLYAYLAAAELGAGRSKEALLAADKGVRVEPSLQWAHRLRARALGRLGRRKEALDAAREAVRIDARDPDALEELASQQLALEHFADAEQTATELIRTAPAWPESFNTRGRIHLKRGQNGLAEADFREALRLAPNEAIYMNNLGLALHRRGRRKEALDMFGQAAVANPDLAPARSNLYASTARYLWGGGLVLVGSLLLHAIYAASGGTSVGWTGALLLVGAAGVAIVGFGLRYWLRKRGLSGPVKNFYEMQTRRERWRLSGRFTMTLVGFLILTAAFVASLVAKQTFVAGLVFGITIVWLHQSGRLWRFANRRLSRL